MTSSNRCSHVDVLLEFGGEAGPTEMEDMECLNLDLLDFFFKNVNTKI